ncbi:plastocyanin [uncultured Methylobacterium sp.]|uniref:plastocyanin n=1 Tax=uncultured Methylobacterium sp. TaxID=157278 RepID=UPI0035C999B7
MRMTHRSMLYRAAGMRSFPTVVALLAGLTAGAAVATRIEASGHLVSQKGRAFQPNSLVVARGDTVTIVNDDSDLLHHVYIEAESFAFDSGDQLPGSRTPVTFQKSGTFQVLCGIHPKMKLIVRVN